MRRPKNPTSLWRTLIPAFITFRRPGLGSFSVYGPWGRPDMALYLFAQKIAKGEEIEIFNNGDMQRDFHLHRRHSGKPLQVDSSSRRPSLTKIGAAKPPDPGTSYCPYKVYNIGNSAPVELIKVCGAHRKKPGHKGEAKNDAHAKRRREDKLMRMSQISPKLLDIKPNTDIEEGVEKFISWFKSYHKI